VIPWLVPPRRAQRATEATPQQIMMTGAGPGARDPIDGDTGWRPAGSGGRPVPAWTLEAARTGSVASYRMNPMAKAIVDTYTSFCVGDSGVRPEVSNEKVARVVDEFWRDPRVNLGALQTLLLRDAMLNGEQIPEFLVGPKGGRVRFRPLDPTQLTDVTLEMDNPLWPDQLVFRPAEAGGDELRLAVVRVDDDTGLRTGQAMLFAPWRALVTDRRGMPFMTGILDWLDSYDQVLSNLIDRTALARYAAFDVTVQGDDTDVQKFVTDRGNLAPPPSGTVEVHNQDVEWKTLNAQSGAFEDTATAGSVLTLVAGGAGLAKTWLAEPDGANRATSETMAEPIRRRVAGVQTDWLNYQTEIVRYQVDRAVAAGRLPRSVPSTDSRTGHEQRVPASETVKVIGPKVAAADAQITAQTMLNLSTGLEQLIESGAMSRKAGQVAARVAWEAFTGITYTRDLDPTKDEMDAIASQIEDGQAKQARAQRGAKRLAAVPVTSKPREETG
jgi:hypothetical protein